MKVINQLIELVGRLYSETEDYIEQQDNSQLWYNRGYADGVVKALQDAGFDKMLQAHVTLEINETLEEQRFMPWGKAYFHGFEMGEKESKEVLP